MASYVFAGAWSGVDSLAAIVGVGVILAAVVLAWDDGLVAGPALLLAAYALSLADRSGQPDPIAVLIAIALLCVVELGTWSLELHDGAEEKPVGRLPWIVALLGCGFAVSSVIWLAGAARLDAGLVGWAVGAAAALALFAALVRSRLSPDSTA